MKRYHTIKGIQNELTFAIITMYDERAEYFYSALKASDLFYEEGGIKVETTDLNEAIRCFENNSGAEKELHFLNQCLEKTYQNSEVFIWFD